MPSPNRVPTDRVDAHLAALQAQFPTLSPFHVTRLAGVSTDALRPNRPGRQMVTREVEEMILAVRPEHVAMLPPFTVPPGVVHAHIERLLAAAPYSSRNLIARLSGLSYQTLYNLKEARHPTVQHSTYAAILSVTPAMIRERVPRRPATPTLTRLRALQANGWPLTTLDTLLGTDTRKLARNESGYVAVGVEARVKALYEEIGDRTGPGDRRCARQARALGYHPPICYDDDMNLIPEAVPVRRRGVETRADEARRALCTLALTLDGHTADDIALRTGVGADAVGKVREKARLGTTRDFERQVIRPGQDDLVAAIRERVEGIAYRERTEVLDDEGIDYLARWEPLLHGTWRAAQESAA